MEEWNSEISLTSMSDCLFLYGAITWMLSDVPSQPVTPEQIGLLKTLKIAVELKRMYQKAERDELRCTISDEYEHVKPIMDL